MQGVQNAHRDDTARARIVVAGNAPDLEAQLAESALRNNLVRVALQRRISHHAHFGAIEPDARQTDGSGDVDVLGEAQRALARGAPKELARLTQRDCLANRQQCPGRLARGMRHPLETADRGGADRVESADGPRRHDRLTVAGARRDDDFRLEMRVGERADRQNHQVDASAQHVRTMAAQRIVSSHFDDDLGLHREQVREGGQRWHAISAWSANQCADDLNVVGGAEQRQQTRADRAQADEPDAQRHTSRRYPVATLMATDLHADVALANRIVHRVGLVTGFGHVSARIPGTDTFLFPTRASPALARADRLLVLDLDGNLLEGEGTPNTELWIHARIYAARPDVGAVAHVHSPACVALGQIGEPVRILHNAGAVLSDGVPMYERIGLIRSRELGDAVAATLGQKRAMLLRGHGANVADVDVRSATVVACLLEEAAELQLKALAATGGRSERLLAFTPEEASRARQEFDATGPMARAWEYYAWLAEH